MEIFLEANTRYGVGYQVRIDKEKGDSYPKDSASDNEMVSSVQNESPYTLYEAVRIAGKALDRINELTGSEHQLYEVLWLTQDGVEANARRDIASAKLARELRSGARKYIEVADRLEGEGCDEIT